MYTVVNHLPMRAGIDWAELVGKFKSFFGETGRAYPKLRSALLTKVSDTEAIFLGIYDDEETMKHVSSNVAAPWFAENIRPYLSGATNRSAGEVIASYLR